MTPAPPTPRIFAGTSGWAYPTWKPGFYPADVSAKKFLAFYATRMNSVEVNHTFRKLPSLATIEQWLAATPPGFRFSFKAPQTITHFKRLRDCETAVTDFIACIEPARQAARLGVLLFQLPPNFKADLPRLDAFLAMPALTAPGRPPIAFEFRHPSWFEAPIIDRMQASNAALCVAESDDLASPELHPATGIACFRLRRNGGYSPREIGAFAKKFRALATDREVYAYFKHEDEPTGALNGSALIRCLKKAAR